jgi:lipoate-protein ligase A
VHDRELTYSLCMPSEERWSRENRLLYDSVHEAILASLREFGIEAELYSTGVQSPKCRLEKRIPPTMRAS